MDITPEQVRAHRLRAHHLDRRYPASRILEAAGACGLQNSPPGGWETALFQRLEGCSLPLLRDALYRDRALLQAWSIRGVPLVFPAGESGVFLSPLLAREGECPWIYTRGITAALDFVGMSFDEAHARVREAARCLDGTTVRSKEALDQLLADRVGEQLPPEQRALWDSPSMYGRPDRQTVGPPPALRGRRSWCGDFSTATAPPPPPISRPGWAALPNRRSGSGPPPQRRWNRSGCWAGPAGP